MHLTAAIPLLAINTLLMTREPLNFFTNSSGVEMKKSLSGCDVPNPVPLDILGLRKQSKPNRFSYQWKANVFKKLKESCNLILALGGFWGAAGLVVDGGCDSGCWESEGEILSKFSSTSARTKRLLFLRFNIILSKWLKILSIQKLSPFSDENQKKTQVPR